MLEVARTIGEENLVLFAEHTKYVLSRHCPGHLERDISQMMVGAWGVELTPYLIPLTMMGPDDTAATRIPSIQVCLNSSGYRML